MGKNRAVTDDHAHELFDPGPDPNGRPVNGELLGQFLGAGFDNCTSCQDPLLTLMADDAPTIARLVEVACMAAHSTLGGLPASMTDPDVPGISTLEFRRLAAAGLDGNSDAMFELCAQMTPTERRAAANTAADTLIGYLFAGPPT